MLLTRWYAASLQARSALLRKRSPANRSGALAIQRSALPLVCAWKGRVKGAARLGSPRDRGFVMSTVCSVTPVDMSRRGLDTDCMPAASDLEQARYAGMRWNTPLSEEHAQLLLERLDIRPGASLLDLGCGWGELLLRAVDRAGVTTGIGVDTDAQAIARGRALAVNRGLDGRVTFICGSVNAWQQPTDRVTASVPRMPGAAPRRH